MIKPNEYLKNVAKSIQYAAVDEVADLAPSIAEFTQTNAELFKDINYFLRNKKLVLKRTQQKITQSKIYSDVDMIKNSIFEDIKSGKFYNKDQDRTSKVNAASFGDSGLNDYDGLDLNNLGSMNFDTDGIDDGYDDDDMDMLADDFDSSSRANASAVSQAIASTGEMIVQNSRVMNSMNFAQITEGFNTINGNLSNVSSVISQGVNSTNELLSVSAENSKKYYDFMTDSIKNIQKMINDMLNLQQKLSGQKEQEQEKRRGNTYDELTSSEGVVDLKAYLKMVGKNAMNQYGGMLQVNSSIEGGSMLAQLAQAPLSIIPKKLVGSLIDKNVKKSLEELNASFSGIFATYLTKMNTLAAEDNENPLVKGLATVLKANTQLRSKDDINTAFEKNAVAYNSAADKSLVHIIPTYLSKITAAVTGEPQMVYDYSTGKFIKANTVEKKFKEARQNVIDSSLSEVRQQFEEMMKYINFKGKEKEKFKEDYNTLLNYFFTNGKLFDPSKDLVDYDGLTMDEKNYKMLATMFKDMKKSSQHNFNRGIIRGRQKFTNIIEEINKDPYSIYKMMQDGSISKSIEENKHGEVSKNTTISNIFNSSKDKKGHTIFWYMENIYSTLLTGIKTVVLNASEIGSGNNNGNGRRNRRAHDNNSNNDSNDPRRDVINSILNRSTTISDDSTHHTEESVGEKQNRKYEENLRRMNSTDPKERRKGPIVNYEDLVAENVNSGHMLINRIELDRNARKLEEDNKKREERNKVIDRIFGSRSEDFRDATENIKKFMDNITGVAKKPNEIIAGILDTVDTRLYETLYGIENQTYHGKSVRGIIDIAIINMEEIFGRFADWMDDKIFDPVRKFMDDRGGLKGIFNNFLEKIGIDPEDNPLHNLWANIKDSFKSDFTAVKDYVTSSVRDVYGEVRDQIRGNSESDNLRDITRILNNNNNNTPNMNNMLNNARNAINANPNQYNTNTQDLQNLSGDIQGPVSPQNALQAYQNAVNNAMGGVLNGNRYGSTFDPTRVFMDPRQRAVQESIADRIASNNPEVIPGNNGANPIPPHLRNSGRNFPHHAEGEEEVQQTGPAIVSAGERIQTPEQVEYEKSKNDAMKRIIEHLDILAHENDADFKEKYKGKINKQSLKHARAYNNLNANNVDAVAEKLGLAQGTSLTDVKAKLLETMAVKEIEPTMLDEMAETGKNAITKVANALFGVDVTDSESETAKKFKAATNKTAKKFSEYFPSIASGGAIGFGIGGFLGAPMLGAATGAAINFIRKSDHLQTLLFGEKDENDERQGGLISKNVMDTIKKYVPSMGKYGIAGAVTSLLPFVPGGPIAGLLVGSAVGFMKQNESVKNFLFGEEDGLFKGSKKFMEDFKKKLPGMGVGAVASAFLGPFGLFGNLVAGSAIGFAAQTNKMQDILFGKEVEKTDEDGNVIKTREGGVFGTLNKKIVEPIKEWGSGIKDKTKKFFDEQIKKPFQSALKPFKEEFKHIGKTIANNIKETFNGVFEKFVGKPMGDFINEKIIEPFSKVLNKFSAWVGKGIGKIISAPFKLFGLMGDNLRYKHIKEGRADYMTDEEKAELYRKDPVKYMKTVASSNAKVPAAFEMLKILMSKPNRAQENLEQSAHELRDDANEAGAQAKGFFERAKEKLAAKNQAIKESLHAKKVELLDSAYVAMRDKAIQSRQELIDGEAQLQDFNRVKNTVSASSENNHNLKPTKRKAIKVRGRIVRPNNEQQEEVQETQQQPTQRKAVKVRGRVVRKDEQEKDDKINELQSQLETLKAAIAAKAVGEGSEDGDNNNNGGKSKKSLVKSIADDVEDIRKEVEGQLDGVGYNIHTIANILLEQFGMPKNQVKGKKVSRGNLKRQNFFEKMFGFILKPTRAIKDKFRSFFFGKDGNGGLIGTPMRLIRGFTEKVSEIGAKIGEGIVKIVKLPFAIAGAVKDVVVFGLKSMGEVIKGAMPYVGKILGSALDTVIGVPIRGLGKIIEGTAKGLGKAAEHLIGGIGALAEGTFKLVGLVPEVIAGVGKLTLKIGEFLVKGIYNIGKFIGNGIAGVFGFLTGGKKKKNKRKEIYIDGGTLDTIKVIDKLDTTNGFYDPLFDFLDPRLQQIINNSSEVPPMPTEDGAIRFDRDSENGEIRPIRDSIYRANQEQREEEQAEHKSILERLGLTKKSEEEEGGEKKQSIFSKILGFLKPAALAIAIGGGLNAILSSETGRKALSAIGSTIGNVMSEVVAPLASKALGAIGSLLKDTVISLFKSDDAKEAVSTGVEDFITGEHSVGASITRDVGRSITKFGRNETKIQKLLGKKPKTTKDLIKQLGSNISDTATAAKSFIAGSADNVTNDVINAADSIATKGKSLVEIGKEKASKELSKVSGQSLTDIGKASKELVNKTVGQSEAGKVLSQQFKTASNIAQAGANGIDDITERVTRVSLDRVASSASNGKMLDKFMQMTNDIVLNAADAFCKKFPDSSAVKESIIKTAKKVFTPKNLATKLPKFAAGLLKTAGTAVTLGLSDAVQGTWGLATGLTATQTANMFGVNQKDIDWVMRIISGAANCLLHIGPGWIIDILNEIFIAVTGCGFVQGFCKLVYKAVMAVTGNGDKIDEYEKARESFKQEVDKFNKEYGADFSDKEYNDYTNRSVMSRIMKSDDKYLQDKFKAELKKYGKENGLNTDDSTLKHFAKMWLKNKDKEATLQAYMANGDKKIGGGIFSKIFNSDSKVSASEAIADDGTSKKSNTSTGIWEGLKVGLGSVFGRNKGKADKEVGTLNGFDSVSNSKEKISGKVSDHPVIDGIFGSIKSIFKSAFGKDNKDAKGNIKKNMTDANLSMNPLNARAAFLESWNKNKNLDFDKRLNKANAASYAYMSFGVLDPDEIEKILNKDISVTSATNAVKATATDIKNSSKSFLQKAKDGVGNFLSGIASTVSGWFGKGNDNFNIDVPHISQNDKQWANNKYNVRGDRERQTIADSGCGPAAAAMIAQSNGATMNDASNFALKGGYKQIDGGTTPEFFRDYLSRYGVSTKSENTKDAVKDLRNGHPLILMGQGGVNTPFGTESPHYVVATGLKGNKIVINDPYDNKGGALYDAKSTLQNSTINIATGRGKEDPLAQAQQNLVNDSLLKPSIKIPEVTMPSATPNNKSNIKVVNGVNTYSAAIQNVANKGTKNKVDSPVFVGDNTKQQTTNDPLNVGTTSGSTSTVNNYISGDTSASTGSRFGKLADDGAKFGSFTMIKDMITSVSGAVKELLGIKDDEESISLNGSTVSGGASGGIVVEDSQNDGTAVFPPIEMTDQIAAKAMRAFLDSKGSCVDQRFKDAVELIIDCSHNTSRVRDGKSQKNRVDPLLLTAVFFQESGGGAKSPKHFDKNNPGSCMSSSGFMSFNTLREGIECAIDVLVKGFEQGGADTIGNAGKIYCPTENATNDPYNLNGYWVPNVTKFYKELRAYAIKFGGKLQIDASGAIGGIGEGTEIGKSIVKLAYTMVGKLNYEMKSSYYIAPDGQSGTADCSSFVQWVFKQHGLSLPRTSREQATKGSIVNGKVQAGDLIFYSQSKTSDTQKICHVGLCTGSGEGVLHHGGGASGHVKGPTYIDKFSRGGKYIVRIIRPYCLSAGKGKERIKGGIQHIEAKSARVPETMKKQNQTGLQYGKGITNNKSIKTNKLSSIYNHMTGKGKGSTNTNNVQYISGKGKSSKPGAFVGNINKQSYGKGVNTSSPSIANSIINDNQLQDIMGKEYLEQVKVNDTNNAILETKRQLNSDITTKNANNTTNVFNNSTTEALIKVIITLVTKLLNNSSTTNQLITALVENGISVNGGSDDTNTDTKKSINDKMSAVIKNISQSESNDNVASIVKSLMSIASE